MKKLIVWLMLIVGFLSACAPQTAVDPSLINPAEKTTKQYPESDNGKSWSLSSVVEYDTQVYSLSVKVLGEMSSNQTVNGSFSGFSSGGFGYASGRMWTEGKGILPVQILELSPTAKWIDVSLPFILKTSDLKIMGVPAGAVIQVICNHDVEVLSPVFSGQTLTTDRLTDELDNCRMVTANYTE